MVSDIEVDDNNCKKIPGYTRWMCINPDCDNTCFYEFNERGAMIEPPSHMCILNSEHVTKEKARKPKWILLE